MTLAPCRPPAPWPQGQRQPFSAFAAHALRHIAASRPEAAAASLRGLVSGFTHYGRLSTAQRRTLLFDTEARLRAATPADPSAGQAGPETSQAPAQQWQDPQPQQPQPQARPQPEQLRTQQPEPQPEQAHAFQSAQGRPAGRGASEQLRPLHQAVQRAARASPPQQHAAAGAGSSAGRNDSRPHIPPPQSLLLQQTPSPQQPPPLVGLPPAAANGAYSIQHSQSGNGASPQGGAAEPAPNILEPSAERYSQMLPHDAASNTDAAAALPDDELVLVNGRLVRC